MSEMATNERMAAGVACVAVMALWSIGLFWLHLARFGGTALTFLNPPSTNQTLLPFVLEPLPLGSIKPSGWLKDQMQTMADGLAGHEHDFYPWVANSSWLGGSSEYSKLNEGFPYWFNGLVPLAYGLDDERLKGQVQSSVDYVISHQADDGWIGPENGTARNFWGRMPLCLGLMNLVDADSSYEATVLPALYKFVGLMHDMLSNNYTGYLHHDGDQLSEGSTTWGRVRFMDMIITLQWMYEKHPGNSSKELWENMQYLHDGAMNWDSWFQDGVYIKEDLNDLPIGIDDPLFPYEHGVNAGQGLKAGAVVRRFTHNDTLLQPTRDGVNWTFSYHGSASGSILADERLAGLSPYYASELCTAVETMYSLSYLYQSLGDNDFADKCELAAFNALPVMLAPDWWSHQYGAQPNQPWAKNLTAMPFFNMGSWTTTFGLEPNYPCCTVNHPQGYPKFLAAMFAKVGDNGLAHALLSPGTVTTTLSGGGAVSVECTTSYPFGTTLSYRITSTGPFDFYIRVPSWTELTYSSITQNGSSTSLSPDPHTGLHKISISSGGTTTLSANIVGSITTTPRANDTIAIHHGALLYALQISSTNTSSPPQKYNNASIIYTNAPAQSREIQLTNTSLWNIAIDPSTLTFSSSLANSSDDGTALANPIWAPGAPPTEITAKGCAIEWPLWKGIEGGTPDVPPPKSERRCLEDAFEVTLVPYGSAKVHMAELPTIDLGRSS